MTENYAIEPIKRELTPSIWGMLKDVAPTMAKTHMMSIEKAQATMLKGWELGLSITASFELVEVVQGRTSLSPRGALALLHNSPVIDQVKITRLADAKGEFLGYECYIKRKNGFEYTSRFMIEDAKRAGLIKPNSAWVAYPENMCQWRAIGFCADVAASDVTCGLTALLKMPEQFNKSIDDTGNIIDGAVLPNVPELVEGLVNRFGAGEVLAANDGNIPATIEEVNQVTEKLEHQEA